jgi:DNA-dependent protein kinase catalytic subunit
VLASLRGDDSSTAAATAAEFTRLAPRVPSWLFLEWLPQLYLLLDTPGPGGDAALAVVESLASTYPSAAYAEHRVARADFSRVGAARCARRVDATLVSPAGEAFARAVTLLDFPAQRLAWWRAHVKLLVAGAAASAAGGAAAEAATRAAAEAAFGAAEAAVRDVGEPDEPHLGALNRRFAQLAKGPLSRAISEARRKLPRSASEACKALVANFADAEKTIAERWRSSSGAAATEARPRLALAHFSRWFAAFDGSGVMDGINDTRETETLNPADADWAARVRRFRGGVEIPGQYDAPAGPPRVEEHALLVGFEPEVAVFASKQRPKKICLRGSDGREYVFIAKGSEDLRQDDRVERLFAAMDGLFAADPASKRRGLHARTFHVAPLSRRAGLLEYVAGTTPMLEALGARTKLGDAVGAKHQHWVKAQAMHPSIHPEKDRPGEERKTGGGDYSRRRRTPGAKLSAPSSGAVSAAHFLEAMATTPRADARTALASLRRRAAAASSPAASREKPALRRALLRAAGSPEAFLAFRSRFAASVAAGSMCGWVAGVGDRHLQNILLDTTTGSVVHIDFGYAFGTATSALPIPELAPFRLTDAMLGGLAPNDGFGALRGDMVIAMRALRGGAALLRGVADAFLRSPLADWRREAAQARVKAGRALDRDEGAEDVLQKRDAADALEEEARALRRARFGGGARVGATGGENMTGEEARHVELKVAHAFCKLELGNPGVLALMQCDAKHSGRAHWRGLREMVLGAPAEGDDDAAARGAAARRAAGDALRCDSVEQQVACLLELATDPLVLATSWSGWRPWL